MIKISREEAKATHISDYPNETIAINGKWLIFRQAGATIYSRLYNAKK